MLCIYATFEEPHMHTTQEQLETLAGFRISRAVGRIRNLPLSTDELLVRAHLLPPPEATLIRCYLERVGSVRTLAKLTGWAASTITRRCRRLVNHLAGNHFPRVMQFGRTLLYRDRLLFYEHFLIRKPVTRLSRDYRMGRIKLKIKLSAWQQSLQTMYPENRSAEPATQPSTQPSAQPAKETP
jgi:hypothetical protein